jgi:hypothetical protein
MTTPYGIWTPHSGTHELAAVYLGRPNSDLDTQPMHVPSFATRHEMPRVRRLRRLQRIADSAMVRDIRDRLPIIPEAIGAVFAAFVFIGLLRGAAVVAMAWGLR